jgi:nucleotide-binding universal stress UspA family protein
MSPSKEVSDAAVVAPDYDELEREAQQLRAMVKRPSEKELAAQRLAEIERQIAHRREADGVAAAKKRRTGIRRALGSHLNEYGTQRDDLHKAVAVVRDLIQQLNGTTAKIRLLHAEDDAVRHRFALDAVTLPQPANPEQEIDLTLPSLWIRRPVPPPSIEQDDVTGLRRERRSYRECEGTEGYAIIMAAPREWPALTPEQQALVAEMAEDLKREQQQLAEFAREAEIERVRAITGGNVKRD